MVWHGNAQHRGTRRHPTIRRGSRVGGDERPAGCGGDASALHAQLHSVRGERGGVVGVDDGGSKRRTAVAVAVARHNVRFNTATHSSRPQTRQHSHTRTHTHTHTHTHKRQPHKTPEQSQHQPFPQRTRPRRLRRDPRGTHGKWSDPSAVATAVRWPRSRTPEAPSRGAPQLPPPEACGVVMAQPPRPVCQPSLQPPPGATEQRQGLEPARTWLE